MLDEATDLITMPTKADVPALFAKKGGIAGLAKSIKKDVSSEVFDYTTDKGRKHAKSVAAKVSRSKTLVVEVGKTLNADRRAAIKVITEQSSLFTDEMDALRDEIRQPALDAEKAEADRVAAHLVALDQFADIALTSQNTSGELQAQIDMIEAVDVGPSWEEFEADARAAKAASLEKLRVDKSIAVGREDQAAELEALRLEMAERDEADRIAKAEADAKEAEITAKKVEEDRQAQIEKDKAEVAIKAAADAEQKAKADTEAAEARHKAEQAESKKREERAAQNERDRLAEERREEEAAQSRRKADAEHRLRIRSEIVEAIAKMKPANWEEAVDAMIAGEVPHVTVAF